MCTFVALQYIQIDQPPYMQKLLYVSFRCWLGKSVLGGLHLRVGEKKQSNEVISSASATAAHGTSRGAFYLLHPQASGASRSRVWPPAGVRACVPVQVAQRRAVGH